MKILKTADKILDKILSWLAILPFAGMVILVFAQVYTRFLTTSSLTWSEELSRYLMVYMVFCAAILVARDKTHIRIENVTERLTGTAGKVVAVAAGVIELAFLAIVIYGYITFFPTAAMRTSATNHIPMTLVYLCIPISCFFIGIYFIRDIIAALMKKDTGKSEEE